MCEERQETGVDVDVGVGVGVGVGRGLAVCVPEIKLLDTRSFVLSIAARGLSDVSCLRSQIVSTARLSGGFVCIAIR